MHLNNAREQYCCTVGGCDVVMASDLRRRWSKHASLSTRDSKGDMGVSYLRMQGRAS